MKNAKIDQRLVSKNDLKAARSMLFTVLKPITLALAIVLFIFTLVPAVLLGLHSTFRNSDWVSSNFVDILNKAGGAVQGTFGVAATVAGAIVTVYLADLAIKIAHSTLEVTHGEQRRESERYAREMKVEVVKFIRDFNKAFAQLTAGFALNGAILQMKLYYAARFLAREKMYRELGGFETDESDSHYFEGEALRVASLIKRGAVEGDELSANLDDDTRNHYIEVASSIEDLVSRRHTPASSFSEVLEITSTLSDFRESVTTALAKLHSALSEIDTLGFVSDLISSESAAEESLHWLTLHIPEIIECIKDDDILFDRIGKSLVALDVCIQNASFGEEDSGLSIFETFNWLFLCIFIAESTITNPFNTFQRPMNGSSTIKHLLRVTSPLMADKNQLLSAFSLNIDGDHSFIPRSLLNYRIPAPLTYHRATLEWLLPMCKGAERSANEAFNLPDENPVRQFEKCLDYWICAAKHCLYGNQIHS